MSCCLFSAIYSYVSGKLDILSWLVIVKLHVTIGWSCLLVKLMSSIWYCLLTLHTGRKPQRSDAIVPIHVVNRNSPVFNKQVYNVSVFEKIAIHTPVTNIQALSPQNHKIIYSISEGDKYGDFAVNFDTGKTTLFCCPSDCFCVTWIWLVKGQNYFHTSCLDVWQLRFALFLFAGYPWYVGVDLQQPCVFEQAMLSVALQRHYLRFIKSVFTSTW